MAADPDAILDLIQESVVMIDLKGRVIFWNSGATRLYGWSKAGAIGRNIGKLTSSGDGIPP